MQGAVLFREEQEVDLGRGELCGCRAASAVGCPGIMHPLGNGLKYSHFGSGSCLCCYIAIGLDLFEHGKCFPQIPQKIVLQNLFLLMIETFRFLHDLLLY